MPGLLEPAAEMPPGWAAASSWASANGRSTTATEPSPSIRDINAAAVADDAHRVLQPEYTRDMGCRDFAQTVPHHGVRLDAPGAPQLGEGDLHREDCRLHHLRPVQAGLVGLAAYLCHHRYAGALVYQVVAPEQCLAEHGFAVQQFPAHRAPLRALTGEHEGQPGRLISRRVRGALTRHAFQCGAQFALGPDGRCRPVGVSAEP